MIAAGANTEKNVEKKEIVEHQKARMCGSAHEQSWPAPQTFALCSSSTGRTNVRPKTSVVLRELIARRVSVSWMLVISFSSEAIFSVSDCGSGAAAR